jgi:hypothetical protein
MLPKPSRLGPKPRKPIRRSKPLVSRRTPIAKRKRPRAVRAGANAAAEREADHLWRLIVKERAAWRCERCQVPGTQTGMDGAHVFSRRRMSTRHDLANGLCVCRPCAELLGDAKLNGKPSRMEDFVVGRYGVEWLERLKAKARGRAKFDPSTLDRLRVISESLLPKRGEGFQS